MSWVTEQECLSFLKFLEISPTLNNHGNLKTHFFCFYISELKNLKQTLSLLLEAQKLGWDKYITNDPKTKERYKNTLINMGLLIEVDGELILSNTALKLIDFSVQNNITPDDLVNNDLSNVMIDFEFIILENLYFIIQDEEQKESKTYRYAIELMYQLQEFFLACQHLNIQEIINDLDLLYFCQVINSSGFELKRYFRLDQQERILLHSLWLKLADSKDYPTSEPQNVLEKMIYIYTRSRNKKTIQFDIRLRCRNLLNAYFKLINKYTIPNISKDFTIISTKKSKNMELLKPLDITKTLNLEHQLIITGCPGSGKSTYLDNTLKQEDPNVQILRITAHPEYTYSDLIGCYKPVPLYEKSEIIFKTNGEKFEKGIPRINYQFVVGPLVKQYIMAKENPTYNFVLIIEEINRTNCNTLFGDFFQLLDRKNGESELGIEPMPDLAAYLVDHGLDPIIKLPKNLYIFGTMNAADQGVFPLDSAFRRRWEFIYKGFNDPCLYPVGDREILYGGQLYDWDIFRTNLNVKLAELGIHEDKMIGPYFLKPSELKNPKKVCNKLFLYLWDDVLRFQRSELMDVTSFSDLANIWKDGNGSPLKISLSQES